jgi:hypothetical protein
MIRFLGHFQPYNKTIKIILINFKILLELIGIFLKYPYLPHTIQVRVWFMPSSFWKQKTHVCEVAKILETKSLEVRG